VVTAVDRQGLDWYITVMATGLITASRAALEDDHFDIDAFKARSGPVSLEGIDLDTFRDQPLDPMSLRCLRYMHDVEFHTVLYLRDLLVTPAHRDPTVTTFLTLWNLEEMYHGDALAAVLAAHGEPAGQPRVSTTRSRLGPFDRFAPAAHTVGSIVVGSAWTAVHMTWGAVNEWTAQAAYARLGQTAGHPTLSALLARIMRQEGRHADFYARQADRRLRQNGLARRVTRTALRRWWAPVGSTLLPRTEVAFLARHLFSGEEGRAMTDRIDRRLDALPGLAGLRLTSTAADGLIAA
jgi:hypothetical protein